MPRHEIRHPRKFGPVEFKQRTEGGRQKKTEFPLAAMRHRIGRQQLRVAVTRMAHDEVARPWRQEIACEIGAIILARIKRGKPGKAIVREEPAGQSFFAKSASEERNAQCLLQ